MNADSTGAPRPNTRVRCRHCGGFFTGVPLDRAGSLRPRSHEVGPVLPRRGQFSARSICPGSKERGDVIEGDVHA